MCYCYCGRWCWGGECFRGAIVPWWRGYQWMGEVESESGGLEVDWRMGGGWGVPPRWRLRPHHHHTSPSYSPAQLAWRTLQIWQVYLLPFPASQTYFPFAQLETWDRGQIFCLLGCVEPFSGRLIFIPQRGMMVRNNTRYLYWSGATLGLRRQTLHLWVSRTTFNKWMALLFHFVSQVFSYKFTFPQFIHISGKETLQN